MTSSLLSTNLYHFIWLGLSPPVEHVKVTDCPNPAQVSTGPAVIAEQS